MSSDPLLPLQSGDAGQLPVQAALTYPEPAQNRMTGFDPQPEEGGLSIPRILAALKRYKWLILAITCAGSALGVFATRFLPLEYVTGATIWVSSPPTRDNNPVRSTEILGGQGYSELLRSFNVLEAVVQQQKLYVITSQRSLFADLELAETYKTGGYHLVVSPDARTYTLMTDQDSVLERGNVGDSIGLPFGFRWQPAAAKIRGANVKFTIVAPRGAAVQLAQKMKVSLPTNSSMMRLELTDNDPVRATVALNGVVDHFMVVASELKAYKLRENSRTLDEQSKSVYKELRNAEEKLERFRTDIITQPTEQTAIAGGLVTQPTITTRYLADKVDFEEMQRQRDALMRQLADAQTGNLNLAALLVIPAVEQSPELRGAIDELTSSTGNLATLLTRYTDSSRQVIDLRAKISDLRDREIPAKISQTLQSLNNQIAAKSEYLESAASEIRKIPPRMIQEQRLDRERLSLAGLYTDLQARYQAARLAEATAIPDVKVIDRAAQPQFPSSNRAPQLILAAFAASLGASMALAILLDKTDKRVLYPQQVSQSLGLTILGAIPAIKRSRNGELTSEQAAQFIEAFRTIRVNLAHLFNSTGQITMTVSSPSPGDGKSLTSSNLAVSFAVAGYRTVLIDGDIRRGELHRMFNLGRKPGLLDYLQGEARLEDIVRPSNQPGLWIIPCGTRRQHGPELLGSSAMQKLLEDLRMRYNAVILDSPPLAAGVDSFVLGSATGNLMLVLRAGETDRHLAEAKLTLVDRLPIRVLGAVLNDVRTKDDAYRYYSYAYGYSAEEEQEPAYLPAGGSDRDG